MKIVYIAHCISGNIEENLTDLRRIIRKVNIDGAPSIVPLAPYYADIVSLNDDVPEERERGIRNDIAVLKSGLITELWLTGPRISKGMQAEINLAEQLGIPVKDFINLL